MVHYLKKEYGWDVDEEACKTHMNNRTNGKGMKGYNDCGSLSRYLNGKRLRIQAYTIFIEILNKNLYFMFGSEPYRYLLLMFYKWLLTQWKAAAESNGEVNLILNQYSNLAYVYNCFKNNFGHHLHYVHGDDMPSESITLPNKNKMTKCEKIVLWFNGYYFPILREPTYGPVHTPGVKANPHTFDLVSVPFCLTINNEVQELET